MKILVLSDTHLYPIINEIIAAEMPDFVIHAGDSQLKKSHTELASVNKIVKGNCDFENFDDFELFELNSKTIFLTHGHLQNVGSFSENIVKIAQEKGAQVVIHGHTHVVRAEMVDDVLVLNPGSTTNSRCHYPESYFILNWSDQIELVVMNARTKTPITTERFEI